MLAEAQQFFAFLREADVLVSELRKNTKRISRCALETRDSLFFSALALASRMRLYTCNRSDNIILI